MRKIVCFVVFNLLATFAYGQSESAVYYSISTPTHQVPYSSSHFFSSDSLYLFIGGGFRNNKLTLFCNNEEIRTYWQTSDPSFDAFTFKSEGRLDSFESIGFKLNDGPIVQIEGPFVSNILSVEHTDGTIFIELRNKPPKAGD